ncbi:MAG: hypothetical protein ACRCSG_09075 [Cellulosilyticaceae bacterium]
MKKNKRNDNVFLNFVMSKKQCLIFIMLGSLIGSIIAISMRQDESIFYALHVFINRTDIKIDQFAILKDSLWIYSIQIAAIWFIGLFPNLKNMRHMLFSVISSMYSFTFSCILLMYGLKGILIGIAMMGIQVTMILVAMILVDENASQLVQRVAKNEKNLYNKVLMKSFLIIFVISIINAYAQPYINYYINQIFLM